jgi:hypothetical protein
LPDDFEIDRAIGMFHVHGHKNQCFYRYSPHFIPKIGIVAGEILESLWSTLNAISPATRTATLAHRAEIIDDHTSDSNHKKALGIGEPINCRIKWKVDLSAADALCDRFLLAKSMQTQTEAYFTEMTTGISPSYHVKWEAEIRAAEAVRLTRPAAMDILGARPAVVENEHVTKTLQVTSDGERLIELALSMEQLQ